VSLDQRLVSGGTARKRYSDYHSTAVWLSDISSFCERQSAKPNANGKYIDCDCYPSDWNDLACYRCETDRCYIYCTICHTNDGATSYAILHTSTSASQHGNSVATTATPASNIYAAANGNTDATPDAHPNAAPHAHTDHASRAYGTNWSLCTGCSD